MAQLALTHAIGTGSAIRSTFAPNGGFVYRVGSRLNVGVDVRYTDSDVKLTPDGNIGKVALDSGGTQLGVLVGYHW